MKRLCLFLCLLTISIVSISQSLNDLDNNPSFKGITLGSPISKYSDILEYDGVNKGKTVYQINDLKYYSIFNIKMERALVFEKDGLVWAIILTKKNPAGTFSPKELEALKSSLAFKYGSPRKCYSEFAYKKDLELINTLQNEYNISTLMLQIIDGSAYQAAKEKFTKKNAFPYLKSHNDFLGYDVDQRLR